MKRWITAILAAALCLGFTACAPAGAPQGASGPNAEERADTSSSAGGAMRTITDLGGTQVTLPAPEDIKRVVIVAPPVMSFAVEAIPDTKGIVGVSALTFNTANPRVVEKVFPNWKEVNTAFIDASFTVNKESLLALKPDVIFYYGKVQKQGLGDIDVPSVDFLPKDITGPEAISVAWFSQLRDIFGLDASNSQQDAWSRTNAKLEKLLQGQQEPKSALCVFSDSGGNLVVSGKDAFDAYAQSFFTMSGLRNAAGDLEGSVKVSMEQIYQWDPDLIVVFQGAPAQDLLANTIAGQDWSLLKAWKSGAIYDVPRTTFSWITPCADSSLLPLWLVSKAYPEKLSEGELRTEIAEYYQRDYAISLSAGDLDSILGQREASVS